jgi:predicted tellurium resistance membrane protein TerC
VESLLTADSLISLVTLTFLEIILGIDNVIFISIVCSKVPLVSREKARKLGILFALFVRIGLLLGISWLVSLKEPLFSVFGHPFSGKGLILIAGGLFLIAKSTSEIHDKMEGDETGEIKIKPLGLTQAIIQIVIIDIVFSFDSILTAVGLVKNVVIMIIAVIMALSIMMIYAKVIGDFVEKNPTIKMLALSFLVMIGFLLIIEGFDQHVPKGYVYFAMLFSLFVEFLNMRIRKRSINKQIADVVLEVEDTEKKITNQNINQ